MTCNFQGKKENMGACVVEILGVNYKRWNFQGRLRKLCGISKGLWFYFSLVVFKGCHSFMEFPRVKLCFLSISKGKLYYCLYSQKRNKQVIGELTLLATLSLFVPYSSMCLLQLLHVLLWRYLNSSTIFSIINTHSLLNAPLQ